MKARLEGRLRNNTALSEILAQAWLARASLPPASQQETLQALLKSCSRAQSSLMHRLLARRLRPYLDGRVGAAIRCAWEAQFGDLRDPVSGCALGTSLLLKAPGPGGEKGVIYSSFEINWARLLAFHDAAAVLRDYYLVGATSWSPTNFSVLAAFAGLSRDPIFVGISHADDVSRLGLMRPVVEPLPILASDWIHPDDYAPRPHRERSIDILMVAGFCRFKRHWLLFEALREMPRNLRVVLIGREAPGRTREALLDEARAFGVRQDLEVYTNLEHDELAARQCDARISLALSQREGSCVAAAESLFADSPVAMMEDAHIGARAYLNAETGLLLRRKGLARALMRFHEDSERFAPRRWAQEHIACTTTSARLNAKRPPLAQGHCAAVLALRAALRGARGSRAALAGGGGIARPPRRGDLRVAGRESESAG